MADDNNVVDILDTEEAVFRSRLAGKSVKRIAREHRLTIAAVEQIIENSLPTIDRRMRLLTLQLDLERLDALQETFYNDAVEGNPQAAIVLLKCQERRASLLGLGPVYVDPVQLHEDVHPGPTSTQQLLDALDAIAAEAPASTLNPVTGAPCPAPATADSSEGGSPGEDSPAS